MTLPEEQPGIYLFLSELFAVENLLRAFAISSLSLCTDRDLNVVCIRSDRSRA